MLTERGRPPTIRTSPTPAERSSCGRTSLSAISVSSRSERSPDRAIVTTGAWSLSNLAMIGGRISRGMLRTAMATLSRTSCAATSIWRFRLNVTITIAVPGPQIERSSLIPWIVLICSSSRWASWVSVSSIEAPGSSTRTLTVGRSTAGNRSTPSRIQLAAPTTTKAMTSMVANTGRLMQTSASFCMALLGHGDGLTAGEVAGHGDDRIAALEALDDLDVRAQAAAGRDAHLGRLALTDDQHLLDAGEHDDRGGRHGHHRLAHLGHDLDAREGARPEESALVRHFGLDQQRTVLLLNDRRQPHHATAVERRIALDRQGDCVACADAGAFALGNRDTQAQRMHAHHRGDGRARRQILAHRGLLEAHDAVERREDHGVGELLPSQIELGAALRDDGLAVADFLDRVLVAAFGHQQGRLGRVELGASDQLLLREPDAPIAGEPRVVHHRPRLTDDRRLLGIDLLIGTRRREPESYAGLLQRGLGLLDPQLEVALIELADDLPTLDARAEIDGDFGQAARDLRAEYDLVVGRQGASRRDGTRHRALGGDRDFDFARRRPRGLGLLLLGADRILALAAAQ